MGHGGWQGHRQYPEAKPFCFDPGSMVITVTECSCVIIECLYVIAECSCVIMYNHECLCVGAAGIEQYSIRGLFPLQLFPPLDEH